VKLRKTLEKNKGPAYFYVYFGSLDSISHEYGPHSEEYKAELSLFSFAFKKLFLEKLDEKTKKETKMLVTADHGQVKISPKETLYLNKFLTNEDFARGKKENPILPTGGPRDLFLHIERSKINEVKDLLAKKLNNFAKVEESKVAIKNGLFGINKPKKKFYDRVGDLLVIPYKNNSVWYEHMKGNKIVSLGHHGGLNKEEMIVPLAITELGDLK
jgi:predicted AlkP superfamily pyrophosphatase or phosphodiesterase